MKAVSRTARVAGAIAGGALAFGAAMACAQGRWCLGMGGIGPVRAGMTVEQVLPLADWSGFERRRRAESCWYLRYDGPQEFRLMIIDNHVVRIEITGKSTLHTFAGAAIGTTEEELHRLYGGRLDDQPHKYDAQGRALTLKSGGGDFGLRFETSRGRVTAIQGGPSEHLNYVEGCS